MILFDGKKEASINHCNIFVPIWFDGRWYLIWWEVKFDFIEGEIWFHRSWNLIWWKVKLLIWEVSQWEPGCWWCEGASGDYYYCMGGCWVWCILYFEILNFFVRGIYGDYYGMLAAGFAVFLNILFFWRGIWWLFLYGGCRVCCCWWRKRIDN